ETSGRLRARSLTERPAGGDRRDQGKNGEGKRQARTGKIQGDFSFYAIIAAQSESELQMMGWANLQNPEVICVAKQEFNNLEQYEGFIQTRIKPWSPAQRIALAAGMAERWLHAYETFSNSENWGDPAILRRSLDAVLNRLGGQASSAVKWSSLSDQVQNITPHMDDFDANEALCACAMIQYAIDCCTEKDNNTPALMAVLSGLEAVQPDLLEGDPVPARLWKNSVIHKEIDNQLRLVETIQSPGRADIDYQAVRALLADPQMAGEVQPREESGPVGRTNQEIYEQYRQIIQMDIKGAAKGLDPRKNPQLAAMLYLAAWMGRYSRRKQMLSGEYGPLIDQTAIHHLLAKNQAKDLAVTAMPVWDANAQWTIDVCYQNTMNGLDASTPESAHGYGPSLRRLWVEAKQRNLSDADAWEAIETWARFQPEAWGRKSKGAATNSAALQAALARPLSWSATGNPDVHWKTEVDGDSWQVRLNDFPDEVMYTLTVNGEVAGDFHDWPKGWQRE
ncbi:MAG TPA: hypothetical protein DDW79_01565, partial [Anaerolineae bacterium]|nr:hypothetical protein [Anaerolineae bacterium]